MNSCKPTHQNALTLGSHIKTDAKTCFEIKVRIEKKQQHWIKNAFAKKEKKRSKINDKYKNA